MHQFRINFKKSVRDRAAEYSARAYNHYQRFSPHVERFYRTFKDLHSKVWNNNKK